MLSRATSISLLAALLGCTYAYVPSQGLWQQRRSFSDPSVASSAVASSGCSLLTVAERHRLAPVAMAGFAFEFAFDEDEDEDGEALTPFAREQAETRRAEEEAEAMLTDKPAENMTVAELQTQLKQLGQRYTGKKSDLIERVQLMQRKRALGLPIHEQQIQREGDMRWYMIQTANGFERAVETSINMAIRAQRLESKIEKVWVPILEGETLGARLVGHAVYIFIRMVMDASLHFLISDMQYVINFVGADLGGRSTAGQMTGNRGFVRPMPVSDEAYERAVALTRVKVNMGKGDGEGEDEEAVPLFSVDDMAEVVEGPFKGMQGPVLAVGNPEEEEGGAKDGADMVTLALSVMGRDTPVTLPLAHCRKVGSGEGSVAAA